MIGETNINGGAGLNGKGALLEIKAETGSTITVSKESYSKTIKVSQLDPDDNNWSYWIFQTTNFGEWTINATNGSSKKATTNVNITEEGQQEEVILTYNYYLIRNGVLTVTDWTIARGSSTAAGIFQGSGYVLFSTENNATGGVSGGVNMVAATTNPVDISDYQFLRITIAGTGKSHYSSGKVPLFGVGDTRPTSSGTSATVSGFDYYKMLNSGTGDIPAGTYEVNVSALSGNYYIAVTIADNTGNFTKAFINVTEFVLVR